LVWPLLGELEWRVLGEVYRGVRVRASSLRGRVKASEAEFSSAVSRLSSEGFIRVVDGWLSLTLAGRMIVEFSRVSGGRRWIVAFTGGRRGVAGVLRSMGFARFKAGVWFAPYSEKVYGDVSSVRGVEVAVCRCSFLGRVWGEFTAHREAERLVMRAKRLVERAERFMAERGDDRVGFDVWDMCLDALSTLRRALGRAESAGLSVEG